MALVRTLDGRWFDVDDDVLERHRISGERVEQLDCLEPLPDPPQRSSSAEQRVRVRRGPGDSIVIDIIPGGNSTG